MSIPATAAPAARLLIVTADDFGLHPAVNEAVGAAHRAGTLTAASLMVAAPAAAHAVRLAHTLPGLRVGLHLTLADGAAVLPRRLIPDLIDEAGRFGDRMVRDGVRFFASRRIRAQLAAEIRAQFEAFARTGLALDHVDAHKHFHLHPTVLGLLLRIGGEFGLGAVRVPAEPPGAAGRATTAAAALGTALLQPWLALMRHRLRGAHLAYADQVFGIRDSGAMDEARQLAVLAQLPPGITEIYLHPATLSGGELSASMHGYRHRDELAGLLSPRVRAAMTRPGIRLGAYGDIAAFAAAHA